VRDHKQISPGTQEELTKRRKIFVECFEEKAALRHPIFKPVRLPDFQIGADTPVPA